MINVMVRVRNSRPTQVLQSLTVRFDNRFQQLITESLCRNTESLLSEKYSRSAPLNIDTRGTRTLSSLIRIVS